MTFTEPTGVDDCSLAARAVGWIEAEVDEWMRERIAASRRDGD